MSGTGTDAEHSHHNTGQVTSAASEETHAQPQEAPLVLIAEDDGLIAETIGFLVQDNGYRALVASNGQQALALARLWHPALVITDLMMPFLAGDDLIRLLRADAAAAHEAAPHTILISAAGWRRMLNAGADAVLSKPFDLDELEKLILRFLGQQPGPGKPC